MNKWGKAAAAALLGLTVAGGAGAGHAGATAAGDIRVILDDVPISLGLAPVIANNSTMVPFRALAQALGIRVTWNGEAKSVHARGIVDGEERNVVLRLGQRIAEVDGQPVEMLAAPLIVNNQVLIPLKFFGTQFGARVGWNAQTRTVTVVSPVKDMHLRAFYALGSFAQRDRISAMNSVAFGWARIDDKGELTFSGADYYWPAPAAEATPEELVRNAAEQGIDPYLMVYAVDGKGELTKMLSDDALRAASIDGIAKTVAEKGFAGVLLDFEGLGLHLDPAGQQKLLNDYVAELVPRLKPLGVKLSLAVPPPNGYYKGYDYRTLAAHAEDLVLMAYDYHPKGTPERTPEPNGKVAEAIEGMLAAGVPADRLVLGINLWSESPTTVDDKLGLAKRYGLKGASFWRLTFYGDEFAAAIDQTVRKAGE
ncbi:stalk domain-containing protein [Paenibacillaceae bacterium WGS1546]|uniref:stalk domain-containing protein n=1 Tax=Cohnella sp. WGS1546 TaxID=3366810 RepID=UPI00372D3D16